jgi:energy-coupling factor transport system permease protein
MKQRIESFHPLTWWLLGISLSLSSTVSASPVIPAAVCVLAILVMAVANRFGVKGNLALSFYLLLAVGVIISRLVFKVVFNVHNSSEPTLLALPRFEVNLGFGDPVTILGNVSATTLLSATLDGTRLAAIILGIALAVTLAEPKKLLRSTPAALFEIGAAVSMAINLVPQLIKSYKRVKQAQKLRGITGRVSAFAGTAIPVLEDAIDSSLTLAASMSSRGFGLQVNSRARLITGLMSLVAVLCIAVASYLTITSGSEFLWLLLAGLLVATGSLFIASKAAIRTKLVPGKFRGMDWIVAAAALAIFAATYAGRIS